MLAGRFPRRRLTPLAAIALCFLLSGQARAADPEDDTAAHAPYWLEVNSDDPAFSTERLAPLIARELGRTVTAAHTGTNERSLGLLTVSLRPSRGELAVTFQSQRRGVVSRVVEAPPDVEEAARVATYLSVNLVRDEVGELLGAEAHSPPPPPPPPPSSPKVALSAPPAPRPYSFATASFFHPVATNADMPDVRTRLNVNLLYGRVGQLDGLQLGGFGLVAGDVTGAQVDFLGNVARGSVAGLQGAIGFNWAQRGLTGLQLALFANGASWFAGGIQAAGFGNWVEGPLAGGQLAVGVNVATGPVRGMQAALGLNVSGGHVVGLQAAAVNVAPDVDGVQVGFVNVAAAVHGLQIGIINVADDIEGVPLGLVSVTKSGGVHPMFWSSTQTPYNLGIKFATKFTYTALTASAGKDGEVDQLGPGYLLGVRVPLSRLAFETDVGATFLFGGKACCVSRREGLADDRLLARWRAQIGFALRRHLGLFVGAGATVAVRFQQGVNEATTASLDPEVFAGVSL